MRRKRAVRSIRRATSGDSRPLEAAPTSTRRYPDVRSLGALVRAASARAVGLVVLPAAGLAAAGCGADPADLLAPVLDPIPIFDVRIGEIVEGLKPPVASPPTQIVPLGGAVAPVGIEPITVPQVLPDPVPIMPPGEPPAVLPDPAPPAVDGEIRSVEPVPPEVEPETTPTADRDPPMVRGLMSIVRPEPPRIPGGVRRVEARAPRVTEAAFVPRTLSDEALEEALRSIR